MKKVILLSLVLSCYACAGKVQEAKETPKKLPNTQNALAYNDTLAKRLGADEYGMKRYVMAFLKRGKTQIKDSTARAELQKKHLQNIDRLAKEGKLIVAGPFLAKTELRGIFIFHVESIEEAKKLTESDPAIQAGMLEMELQPWYSSAALIEVPKIHRTLEKKAITEPK